MNRQARQNMSKLVAMTPAKYLLLIALGLFLIWHNAAAAATATNVRMLKNAIAGAQDGDIITVASGRYDIGEIKIRSSLTIIGEGDVTFTASAPVEKGLLNPLSGVSLRIENITLEGARAPDKNGAGIRHDGAHLTIIACRFINNENGVLATGAEESAISIYGSSFINNGHGDGYSHGIYVVRAATLSIYASKFIGTKIGHHVKSLAAKTTISLSVLDDADGRASYAVDVSKGGDVTLEQNTFIQAANGDNAAIINFDLTRGGAANKLTIANNLFVNRHRNGLLLRNDTALTPDIYGNKVVNEGRGRLAAPQ